MKDTKYKLYIGIDPGKGGGIAIICEEESWSQAYKFPKELEDLAPMIGTSMGSYSTNEICVMIEHVHSFPTDGRPAAFSFGRNLGHWEGVLSTFELNKQTVAPRTWQEHYDIPIMPDKYERKRWLKEVAQELFPNIKVTLALSDALLIANYAKELQYYKKGKENNGKSNRNGKSTRQPKKGVKPSVKKSKTTRAPVSANRK